MRPSVLLRGAAVALALAACNPPLTVPPGAKLTCTVENDECPPEYRCIPETLLCAKTADVAPVSTPGLQLPGDATGTQTAVKNGDRVTIKGTTDADGTVFSARLVYDDESHGLAMALDPGSVGIDAKGGFFGTFTTQGLLDEKSVMLEVLVDARGYRSAAAKSLSAPVPVDLTKPTASPLALASGQLTVSDAGVTLAITAVKASQMYLDGDLVDGAGVRAWVPYASSLDVRLVDDPQTKLRALKASFRDEAFNVTTPATTYVNFTPGQPVSNPTIKGPVVGVAKTRQGAALAVGGTADSDTTLVSAEVVSFDAQGAELVGPGCSSSVATVTLVNGQFGGTATTGTPCAGAASVRLRAVVRNSANATSDPAFSLSAPLTYDDQAPAHAVAHLLQGDEEPGYSATAQVRLRLSGSEPDSSPVRYTVFEQGQSPPQDALLPADGGSVDALLTFGATSGAKTGVVRFTDEIGNFVDQPVNVTVLLSPPAAPLPSNLRLVERALDPFDAGALGSMDDAFFLSWTTGAANVDRALLFSGAGALLTPDSGIVAIGPAGFDDAGVPPNAAEAYQVVVMDKAGNRSPPTGIATPPMTLAPPVLPARLGNPVALQLTSAQLSSISMMVGRAAGGFRLASPSGTGVGTQAFFYTADGQEPEGLGQAVVRVTARDGRGTFDNQSMATVAALMTFDFHAPVFDDAGVTLAQNPPGTPDTIAGAVGTAFDAISPAGTLTVELAPLDGGPAFTTLPVNADGGFGPYVLGDNTRDGVLVRVLDQAGNATARVPFVNDVTSPALTNLTVSPGLQRLGGVVSVDFDVADDLSTLGQTPVVMVGAGAASCPGALSLPRHVTCTYTVQAGDGSKVQLVGVSVVDAAGNPATATTTVSTDVQRPVSTNANPGTSGPWNGTPSIGGNATDDSSGVALVEVSLQAAGGSYWNGTGFASATPVWLAASGLNPWTLPTTGVPFATGASYGVQWRATDVAGNVEAPGSVTFTFDPTQPAAPATLTAQSVGEARVDLAWAAAPAASAYTVSFGVEPGTPAPPGTITSTLGPSPLTVPAGTTSLTVAELPRGRYTFRVTAVDSTARESPFSPPASAASRWWKYEASSQLNHDVSDLITVGPGALVAVGERGTIWVTQNAGASWTLEPSGTLDDLRSVVKAGTALVAVSASTIVRSTDGGGTWAVVQTGTYDTTATKTAYANGSKVVVLLPTASAVLVSTDGGATFTSVSTGLGGTPASCLVGSGDRVVVFTQGGAAVSSDGGQTWAVSTGLGALGPSPVAYLNGAAGVVSDFAGTFTTVDGAASWQAVAAPPIPNQTPGVMVGAGATVVLASKQASGSFCDLAVSTNGGLSWTASTQVGTLCSTGWTDGTHAVITGSYYGSGAALSAAVASNAWTRSNFLNGPPFLKSSRVTSDGTTLVGAGGEGTIRFAASSDFGATWTPPTLPVHTANGGGVAWTSGKTIVTVSGTTGNRIARSLDDGETWTSVPVPSSISQGYALGGTPSTLFLAGAATPVFGSRIFRSTDLGATWALVADLSVGFLGGLVASGGTAVAVGDSGLVFRSTNGGLSWAQVSSGTSNNLLGVVQAGPRLIAYGDQGELMTSTDVGATWTRVLPAATTLRLSTAWVDSGLVIFGSNGTAGQSSGQIVVYSLDGGQTFAAKKISNRAGWTSSIFSDGTRVLVGGRENSTATGYVYVGDHANPALGWSEWSPTGPTSNNTGATFSGSAAGLFAFGTTMPWSANGSPWDSYTQVSTTHWVPVPPPSATSNYLQVITNGLVTPSGAVLGFDPAAGAVVFGPR